jgi:hypothetical protein
VSTELTQAVHCAAVAVVAPAHSEQEAAAAVPPVVAEEPQVAERSGAVGATRPAFSLPAALRPDSVPAGAVPAWLADETTTGFHLAEAAPRDSVPAAGSAQAPRDSVPAAAERSSARCLAVPVLSAPPRVAVPAVQLDSADQFGSRSAAVAHFALEPAARGEVSESHDSARARQAAADRLAPVLVVVPERPA